MALAAPFFLSGDPRPLALTEGPYSGVQAEVLADVPFVTRITVAAWTTKYTAAAAGSQDEAVALRTAWALFADDVLVQWNLLDRAGLVPADASSFGRLSDGLMVALLGAWADLVNAEPETT